MTDKETNQTERPDPEVRPAPLRRRFSAKEKMREPASGLTHFFAGIVAVVGLIALLVVGRGDIGKQISLLVYGAGLLLVFFASSAYHLVQAQPKWVQVLRKVQNLVYALRVTELEI